MNITTMYENYATGWMSFSENSPTMQTVSPIHTENAYDYNNGSLF